ncbi:dihydroxyacetone kinase [Arthrobacter alpinus]|uniref:dihydroxyacetone kinase family protein n=1 Tax=Arthrobacter alpinus TaxID=656366 RepID=UPI0005C93C5E|nr:dihydroxyacetone kinase family protein [Arthrobacter alpinus]ALV46428.1 dihydroxyacetone kinase [Arthrobacter alpinus]
MTKIFNSPADFSDDQFEGFLDIYSDRLRGVAGGAVALRTGVPQVAVVIGGGSGHYPAFAGLVGTGFATGAVVGNIFTSPSAAQVYSVAKAANQGLGVVLSFGNYAGDNMNFGIAAEHLRKEGIDTRIVVVTDDIASSDDEEKRRGIAGDFTVFKVMGAAAAAGLDLDGVERAGRSANQATRTLGVAFSGCTMPGADKPLFEVPEGHLGLGLGIHGEPGISDEAMPTASALSEMLVEKLLKSVPIGAGKKVGVVLNGLGTTKYEELFLLWAPVAKRLRNAGLELVDVEVGELVTSLDMGGTSLTLMWLDEELEAFWKADAYTPAYRKQAAPVAALEAFGQAGAEAEQETAAAPTFSEASAQLAASVVAGLEIMAATLHQHEQRLGEIDAVAGDGDHGRGMVKGIDAALQAATSASDGGAGAAWVLQRAGQAWAEKAGGTSGVLWGAALEAAGTSLENDRSRYSPRDYVAAAHAFADAILELGRATIGDKTLVDAMLPFTESLAGSVAGGRDFAAAWQGAAAVATEQATATAALSPKLGRARPLAAKSVGTPDAGATSLALLVTALASLPTPALLS